MSPELHMEFFYQVVNNIMNMKKDLVLPHDIKMISRMGKALKLLHLLETTLTVVIIAFTVLRIINIFREQY